jgi:hypothetical protein
VNCILRCFAHASPGRVEWQDPAPGARRAIFDGGECKVSLPLKKARAGQRGWTGPIYLSPDSPIGPRNGPQGLFDKFELFL